MTSSIKASHKADNVVDFLSGGGEMGELMRNYDWQSSPLGSPHTWPSPLKTSLRLLLNSTHPMFIFWGPELIQFYNDACRQTMDEARHPQALGQPGREYWKDIWGTIGPQIEHVMSGAGSTWNEEQLIQVQRENEIRNERWTYSSSPIGDDAIVQGVLVLCTNVTEQYQAREHLQQLNRQLEAEIEQRKNAETRLALNHQAELLREQKALQLLTCESAQRARFYETFLTHTPDLAYVFDLNHRFVYANTVLLKLWGKTWEEAIGKNCLELGYEPWHAEMHDREIEQVIASKLPVRGEVPFEGTFGRRIYDYIFVPVLGLDGEVELIAGTTRDVTERRAHEDKLQQLANDLADANRRKTEFLATLAHELRNPLAPIRTGMELIRIAQHNPETFNKALTMMDRQLNQLVHLIDDLMEISRVNSGKIELRNQRIDFRSVATMATESVSPQLKSAGHQLDIQMCNNTIWLDADPARLAQVISNLLINAIKYTPSGGHIILKADMHDGLADISVIDNGIGIPQDSLIKVFDMFSQVSKNKHHSQGGLGIGLSLVKSLVAMHGGTVTAYSEGEGKGSRFTLKIPLAKGDLPANSVSEMHTEKALEPARPLNILLADDNQDAADALSKLLRTWGHNVEVANEGRTALRIAIANDFNLIILDLGMPGLNGFEVAAEIRKMPHLQHTFLVALTGWGSQNHREQTKEAGFNKHLIKPAAISDIQQLVMDAAST